jgi:hypothetical protein
VILGPGLQVVRGDLNRPSLTLQTIRMAGQAERLAWLAQWLPSLPGSGIVYTLTVRDAQLVAAWLKSRGIEAAAYTGNTGSDRVVLEQALLDDDVKALVATTALGMGFDKPDLAFVIHYQTPGSVVAYYQQVGRAGRALEAARGVLLSGGEDTEITSYFIRSAFPTRNEVEQVLAALEAEVELSAAGGVRRLPVAGFLTGNRTTALEANEIVTAVLVPKLPDAAASAFLKLGARRYLVISIVMIGIVIVPDGDVVGDARIAVGACSPVTRRLPALEAALNGRPLDAALGEIVSGGAVEAVLSPIADVRGSAGYRLDATLTMLRRGLSDIGRRMGAGA